MRTTIVLDDDVVEKLRQIARKRRVPFRRAVNDTLRRGLSAQERKEGRRVPFQVDVFDSPFRPGVDCLRLNALVDELEVQRFTEPRSR